MSLECMPLFLLQDTNLEQRLIAAGADPQQAKDTIAAFQAASAGSSRHLLQDLAAMVDQVIGDMQAGLDPVQARDAVLAGSSRRRHLLQVGSCRLPPASNAVLSCCTRAVCIAPERALLDMS